MTGYEIINLKDIYKSIGEEETKNIIRNFQCDLNKDVDYFLKEKALEFSKQDLAETFLVFTSYKAKTVLVGYFSITNKVICIKMNLLSESKKRKIKKYGKYDDVLKSCTVALPLIGQLGKNYNCNYNSLIKGDYLLKMACDKIKEAQYILGGRFAYLECEDKPNLVEFYERNGFVTFGKRCLEKDELDKNDGKYLLQMLCDLSRN